MLWIVSGLGLLAVLAPLVHRALPRATPYLLALAAASAAGWFGSNLGAVGTGQTFRESVTWVPSLGVNLSFSLDGLSLLMALLVTGVGALIFLYAGAYLEGNPKRGPFLGYLTGFMASMLGLVLSDNLLLLFIFWELTSVTSYLLIGFDHESEKSRKAAWQALLTTALGGLALMAGVVMIGMMGGSFEISELATRGDAITSHAWYPAALLMILLGAFTKSAQFPFYAWLPGAMAAPTPVSAYLHSSTMVKAGVYLLARLSPVMGGTDAWAWSLVLVGGTTTLLAAFIGTRQTEFKKVLAYSTVSSLGSMVMLIGVGATPQDAAGGGFAAAAAYLLGHALFKGSLFLVAGSVDHATHIKDSERLGGLRRAMPLTAGAALLAGLSMAGVPGFLGFAGKELMLKAGGYSPVLPWLVLLVLGVSGAFMAVMALQVAWRPFWGSAPRREEPGQRREDAEAIEHAHESPWPMWAGFVLLASLSLVLGLAPMLGATGLVGAAAGAMAGRPVEASLDPLKLLSPSLALAISGAALAVGVPMFVVRRRWRATTESLTALDAVGPQAMYQGAYAAVLGTARLATRLLQNGSLSNYLRITVFTLVAGAGWALLRGPAQSIGGLGGIAGDASVGLLEAALVVFVVVGCVGAVVLRSRLGAIVSLGSVGYAMALIFVLFGAPDVAMTQFAMETLSVVLFVLVLYHMPRYRPVHEGFLRVVDGALALGVGAVMTCFVLLAARSQTDPPISGWFVDNAVSGAKGRNVVNVIIVDFRALDTLGEIAVLATAAIGIYTLLTLRKEPGVAPPAPPVPATPIATPADSGVTP